MAFANFRPATVTVATDATHSDAINLDGSVPVGIMTPAVLTSTAITFEQSEDGSQWNTVRSSSGAVSLTVAALYYVGFNANEMTYFRGVKWLRLVFGSTEGANRVVKVATIVQNAL